MNWIRLITGLLALLLVATWMFSGAETAVVSRGPTADLLHPAFLSPPLHRVVTNRAHPIALTPGAPAQSEDANVEERLKSVGFNVAWLIAHGFSHSADQTRLATLIDARRELPEESRHRLNIRPSSAQAGIQSENPVLAPEEHYVVAEFISPFTVPEGSVIVRWRRAGDNSVMEIAPQQVPDGESMKIWMFKPAGWEPGSYRLEVISATPQLKVLASAEFQIAAPGSQSDAFAYPVLQ